MIILLSLLSLIFGIILVAKGGDFFVDSSAWIAKAAGIPSFIIGATIVSIATTLPEMIVSCIAAHEGKIEMAIGNAVGSVTANTALIMAIAFIFMNIVISRKGYIYQCTMLILSAAVLCFGVRDGFLRTEASVILIAVFILFMIFNVNHAKNSEKTVKSELTDKSRRAVMINAAKFVGGAAAIVVGSRFLINGGSSLATYLGVPERIIAVTLVAVGTSIPELVTTVTAIRKKESALSVGNIIGANIIDLSLILPLCSLISGEKLPVNNASAMIDIPVCLGVTLIAVVPLLIKEKSEKIWGLVLLTAYSVYLVLTL